MRNLLLFYWRKCGMQPAKKVWVTLRISNYHARPLGITYVCFVWHQNIYLVFLVTTLFTGASGRASLCTNWNSKHLKLHANFQHKKIVAVYGPHRYYSSSKGPLINYRALSDHPFSLISFQKCKLWGKSHEWTTRPPLEGHRLHRAMCRMLRFCCYYSNVKYIIICRTHKYIGEF